MTVTKILLLDGSVPFDVTRIDAAMPICIVLFSVGSGGNPERHMPLLNALAQRGCTVIAPHFDRLTSPKPTADELSLRAGRLKLALDSVANPNLPTYGVGHSIGATMLLALSGAKLWLGPQQHLPVATDARLNQLVLMAPATGFFEAPDALENVHIHGQLWSGTNDKITPPAQAEFLKQKIGDLIDLRLVESAGHFSFMNTLPPQTEDSLPNREAFLNQLAADICRFLVPLS